jgi:hypothetical protein
MPPRCKPHAHSFFTDTPDSPECPNQLCRGHPWVQQQQHILPGLRQPRSSRPPLNAHQRPAQASPAGGVTECAVAAVGCRARLRCHHHQGHDVGLCSKHEQRCWCLETCTGLHPVRHLGKGPLVSYWLNSACCSQTWPTSIRLPASHFTHKGCLLKQPHVHTPAAPAPHPINSNHHTHLLCPSC